MFNGFTITYIDVSIEARNVDEYKEDEILNKRLKIKRKKFFPK